MDEGQDRIVVEGKPVMGWGPILTVTVIGAIVVAAGGLSFLLTDRIFVKVLAGVCSLAGASFFGAALSLWRLRRKSGHLEIGPSGICAFGILRGWEQYSAFTSGKSGIRGFVGLVVSDSYDTEELRDLARRDGPFKELYGCDLPLVLPDQSRRTEVIAVLSRYLAKGDVGDVGEGYTS